MKLLKNLSIIIEQDTVDNTVYQGLKDFLDNKISANRLERYDDLFDDVKDSKSGNRKLSTITLKFSDVEDYFKTFDLGDDDENFVSRLFSYYGGDLNIYDSYYSDDDWKDGRIAKFYFNDENKELLKEIIKFVSPEWYKVDISDWEDSVFIRLANLFDNQIDSIKSDYSTEMNYAYENAIKEDITKDFENLYQDYGLYLSSSFSEYYTTPLNLIYLYDKYDPTKKKSLKELLGVIGEEIRPWGDFWDAAYQVDTSSAFDDEGFNRQVNWQLEKIKDRITDGDAEVYSNFDKFKDIVEKILNKFEFNRWYVLPVNPGKSFKINEIDPDTNKVKISVKNNTGGLEQKYLLTLEGFYSFMYNYKLFD